MVVKDKCEECLHDETCKYKVVYKQNADLIYGLDVLFADVTITCKHFRRSVPTPRTLSIEDDIRSHMNFLSEAKEKPSQAKPKKIPPDSTKPKIKTCLVCEFEFDSFWEVCPQCGRL